MHAEATSEKVGLGWYLDGRVTAVVGTHTHVPTADARVLPGGTAYISDVGMTGARGGVIGVKREQAIESMRTQMPVRFETSEEDPWLMGVLIRTSGPMRASGIEQVLEPSARLSRYRRLAIRQTQASDIEPGRRLLRLGLSRRVEAKQGHHRRREEPHDV